MVFRSKFRLAALVAIAFLAAGSDLTEGESEVPTAPNSGKVTVRGPIGGAHYVDIRSPIRGTIHTVASEGPVKKGDLVVELDTTALERRLNNQQIVIARVQQELVATTDIPNSNPVRVGSEDPNCGGSTGTSQTGTKRSLPIRSTVNAKSRWTRRNVRSWWLKNSYVSPRNDLLV